MATTTASTTATTPPTSSRQARDDRSGTSYAELNALLERAALDRHTPPPASDAQLLALQHRWTTALTARLDHTLEFAGDAPLADEVARTWRRLADELPTLRGVLDHFEATSDALARGQDREFHALALAAGLAGVNEPTPRPVQLGKALRDLIRAGHTERVAGRVLEAVTA